MGTHIILVRHARPVIDQLEAAHTWVLDPSEATVVSELATGLRELGPDGIVASPEPKALETGRIISRDLGIPIAIDADLREQGDGQVSWIASPEAFRAAVAEHFARPAEVVLGGESSHAAVDRFGRVVERARAGHRCPVIVTHGRIMCGYLANVLTIDPMSIWPTLSMPDALVLDLEAGQWRRIGKEQVV
jgi:broad specificity phosphatase PhoE